MFIFGKIQGQWPREFMIFHEAHYNFQGEMIYNFRKNPNHPNTIVYNSGILKDKIPYDFISYAGQYIGFVDYFKDDLKLPLGIKYWRKYSGDYGNSLTRFIIDIKDFRTCYEGLI